MYILLAVISALSALNEAASNCNYNYGFVMDESGSVTKTNYDESVDFVIDLIENNIQTTAPVMALSFDSSHRFVYQFSQPQTPRSLITTALVNEKALYNGGGTATLQAMEQAIQQFQNEGYTQNNIIILITDGAGGDPCSVTTQLQNLNIRVIIVGVGGFNPALNECLVLGNTNDIITISNFDFTPVLDRLEVGNVVCDCDENGIDQQCSNDQYCVDNYGACMMCCPGTGKCHKRPEFGGPSPPR